MATHIDPVCGLTVDAVRAAATADHEGSTYYFYSLGCQKAFLRNPAEYISWPTSNPGRPAAQNDRVRGNLRRNFIQSASQ